jgi:hypothetical protein
MGQFGSGSCSQPTHANQFLFGSVDKVTSLMPCLLLLYSPLQTRHLSVTTELRRQLQEGADTPACLAAALEASEEARR